MGNFLLSLDQRRCVGLNPIFVLMFLFFLPGCSPGSLRADELVQGRLNLKEWDAAQRIVRLDGEWEFYWQRLLNPGDFESAAAIKRYAKLPGSWKGTRIDDRKLQGTGYATYRTTIHIAESETLFGLWISHAISAYKVFVNGTQVLAHGGTGTSAQSASGVMVDDAVAFRIKGNQVELVIQVSNFHDWRGGIRGGVAFGTYKNITREFTSHQALIYSMILMLFISGVFYLLLYFYCKSETSFLYFSLVSLLLGVFVATYTQKLFFQYFPEFSWELNQKIIHLSLLYPMLCYLKYIRALFPAEISSRFIRSLEWVLLVFTVITLVTFAPTYQDVTFNLFFVTLGISMLYSIFGLSRAVMNKREGALYILFPWVCVIVSGAGNALNMLNLWQSFTFHRLGVFLFFAWHLVFIAHRFARSLNRAERYSKELEEKTHRLEDLAVSYKTQNESLLRTKIDLKAKNDELIRLDQVKDEFLANTSHELKTPLHGILGIAESLKDGIAGNLPAQATRSLETIVFSARRLFNLVNNILDETRLRYDDIKISPKPLDLRKLIDVTFAVLQPLLKSKSVRFCNYVSPEAPSVLADEDRMQQIFQNLIGNAIKFTESGTIGVSANYDEHWFEIIVADTGCGIAEENFESIFEPFAQVDASGSKQFGGAGLGLSITKKIIELHQGTIAVESVPGAGTKFKFTLPVSHEPPTTNYIASVTGNVVEAEGRHHPSDRSRNSDKSAPRIYVVDDDPVNLEVIVNQLFSHRFNIRIFHNGIDLLAALQQETPDLILLDIMMPGLDGYQVCEKIRALHSKYDLPIIFLTARNRVYDLKQGFDVGGNDYLSKPFAKEELIARMYAHLETKQVKTNLSALSDFSDSGSTYRTIDQLVNAAFELMTTISHVVNGALFQNSNIVRSLQPGFSYQQQPVSDSRPDDPIVVTQEAAYFYLTARFDRLKDYHVVLCSHASYTDLEIEYIKQVVRQTRLIHNGFSRMTLEPQLLSDLYVISSHLDRLTHIRIEGNYCILHEDPPLREPQEIRLSLKTIKLYFDDRYLFQVHRSYLVNPQKISGVKQGNGNQFQLSIGSYQIPVGPKYLSHLRSIYPGLQITH